MWLAYDIGTTGTKAALINDHGSIQATAYQDYPIHTAAGGRVEQNAPDWWQAVVTVTQELDTSSVQRVAITGQMQDVILLRADSQPTRPVMLYSDTRAREEATRYVEHIDLQKLRAATANKQGEGADGLPAKLLWLANHEPDTLDNAQVLLLGAADYITYRLTGQTATDSTTASTTGLMNMAERAPLEPALLPGSIQATLSKLPQIVPGGAEVGAVLGDIADEVGLAPGTPVHIGPGDAGATTLGAGGNQAGTVHAYMGTSGWVAFVSARPAPFESGVITIAHPAPGQHIQIAPLLTAGGNLERTAAILGHPEADYDTLIRAAQAPPANVLYLPYLNGERSPFVDPLARAAFIGIDANTSSETLIRAVLTGVAYGYRHALEVLMKTPVQALTMTGGGTKSPVWMQIFADVLGVPVNVAAQAENVGLLGAVMAASGKQHTLPIDRTFQPQPDYRAFYDAQFATFKGAYPALKPIFAALAADSAT